MTLSNSAVLDTSFRAALDRMAERGRLLAYTAPIASKLEVAGVLKKRDRGPALMFTAVDDYDVPVVGNLLCCQANCEAAFGLDVPGLRGAIERGFSTPLPPAVVERAAAQQHVHTDGIDLQRLLPVLFHTAEDAGRFITAGVVIVRDPETGIYNASYHRLQVVGPNRTAIKLDYGRHLRLASSGRSIWASLCRSSSASAPTSPCNTPPPPWARRCPSRPTSSPLPAASAAGRSRSPRR